jgi:hypothetical protein
MELNINALNITACPTVEVIVLQRSRQVSVGSQSLCCFGAKSTLSINLARFVDLGLSHGRVTIGRLPQLYQSFSTLHCSDHPATWTTFVLQLGDYNTVWRRVQVTIHI